MMLISRNGRTVSVSIAQVQIRSETQQSGVGGLWMTEFNRKGRLEDHVQFAIMIPLEISQNGEVMLTPDYNTKRKELCIEKLDLPVNAKKICDHYESE
jgi:hypothetical protein